MIRTISYLLVGIFFGIVMYKSEAASWLRIYEMFQFQSFHMYGIIGSALAIGIIGIQMIKKLNLKSFYGETIVFPEHDKGVYRYIIGGVIFGLGWALAGTCPGPIYVLVGSGYVSVLVVLVGALAGTFVYGLLQKKLPH